MASAAPPPLGSSVEKTNGAKLNRLLMDGGTTVLRSIFDGYHPPASLSAAFSAYYVTRNNLLRKKVLNRPQWDLLFPPSRAPPDSQTFDITLLFLLLTNICGLSPPHSGWHTKPPPGDITLEANLARIKFYRNTLYGHISSTGIDTITFSTLWQEISAVLVALGLHQVEIDRLKAEHCGEEDYTDALLEWADSEEDIKSQLRDIRDDQARLIEKLERMAMTSQTQKELVFELGASAFALKKIEKLHLPSETGSHMYKCFQSDALKTGILVPDLPLQVTAQEEIENYFKSQIMAVNTHVYSRGELIKELYWAGMKVQDLRLLIMTCGQPDAVHCDGEENRWLDLLPEFLDRVRQSGNILGVNMNRLEERIEDISHNYANFGQEDIDDRVYARLKIILCHGGE